MSESARVAGMKLAVVVSPFEENFEEILAFIQEAEKLGVDSVWVAEAWGRDAVTQMSYIAARTERIKVGSGILQIPARTPAMTAMTAATLDQLSGGRVLLGLGLSGPQVAEGWYGMPYTHPLARTREYVDICRRIWAREEKLAIDGKCYQLPVGGGKDLGKPLKLGFKPLRKDIPVYLATIGPKNVALTAEIAEGWLPAFFLPKQADLFKPWLEEGAARAGRDLSTLEIEASAVLAIGDGANVDAARFAVRGQIGFYLGGMGARGANFYNDLAKRYGYEDAAVEVQDLFLGGKRAEAMSAVPDEMIDQMGIWGSKDEARAQLDAYATAGVTTLSVGAPGDMGTRLEQISRLIDLGSD